MNGTGEFRRVAILGMGLVGASFGAAVERACRSVSIAAYDTPEVLRKLRDRNGGWKTSEDLGEVVGDADLVYVALPVGAIIEMLPEIAAKCGARALVTDAGSTKVQVCNAAKRAFGGDALAGAKFLGGHPIAGKELSGMEHADAKLFRGARYALIGNASEEESDSRVQRFAKLLCAIGAEPVWTDAETHDWALAIVSQMPQLVAVALARVIADETDETGLPALLAGNGLRDMLRIAGSRYDTWRDICLTNADNIARSLDRTAQAIDFLRTHLASRELEAEFRGANEVYKSLRDMH
ncbi:MAG TPA: prephenate dehydrogenase/arogenate dehydrogenase family protein [Candidatus Acidoferrales bacterium]|nr:prephenate dehydrogenase/arogenate dehydrogenase family protein [Candidatus Acidoferrales bacterium]